jgi:hypothetical protein
MIYEFIELLLIYNPNSDSVSIVQFLIVSSLYVILDTVMSLSLQAIEKKCLISSTQYFCKIKITEMCLYMCVCFTSYIHFMVFLYQLR